MQAKLIQTLALAGILSMPAHASGIPVVDIIGLVSICQPKTSGIPAIDVAGYAEFISNWLQQPDQLKKDHEAIADLCNRSKPKTEPSN